MFDKIFLAPYYWILKFRHWLYDAGVKKTYSADVPTISIGNITVGGTGKTPHAEKAIMTLLDLPEMKGKNIAVLSRGYKRKSKGFQQVVAGDDVHLSGDEPLQIKNKFPDVTVAVDRSRVEGCDFLCHPDRMKESRKASRCLHKDYPAADIIILDDAFQHRAIIPTLSILLIDYNRPVSSDHLLPFGKLRDLPQRKAAADVIIITKCPSFIDVWEREKWARSLGLNAYDTASCQGKTAAGKTQTLLFSTISYDSPKAVFSEGDARYIYAKRAVLFTGIANDTPLVKFLSDSYKITERFAFPDHHEFSRSDIRKISKVSDNNPTAIVVTTEKDSQRIRANKNIPGTLKERMFQVPVKVSFLSEEEEIIFRNLLTSLLQECHSAPGRKHRVWH